MHNLVKILALDVSEDDKLKVNKNTLAVGIAVV